MGKSSVAVADERFLGSGGVIAVIELVPRPDKHHALLEALRFVEDQVRRKPECVFCGVFETTDRTGNVLYMEQWESNKGLDAHIRSGLYLRVLHAIELAAKAPKISFHEVSRTRSMEHIVELRNPG
jgi:quinol monooxygenase YgiN